MLNNKIGPNGEEYKTTPATRRKASTTDHSGDPGSRKAILIISDDEALPAESQNGI